MRRSLASMILPMLIYVAVITSQSFAGPSEFHGGVLSGAAAIAREDISESTAIRSGEATVSRPASLTEEKSIEYIATESGRVCSNRTVSPLMSVGYSAGGVTSQAFFSFNISEIPDGSTIDSVAVDMRQCDVLGDPFLNLGCMKAYPVFYNTLNTECYYNGLPLGYVMRVCSLSDLGNTHKKYPDLARALQNAVGSSRFQMRFQFDKRNTVFVGSSSFGTGGKGSSNIMTEVVGEASGEWKPCLPQEPKTTVLPAGSKKDLLQFGTVRLLVTYIPPET